MRASDRYRKEETKHWRSSSKQRSGTAEVMEKKQKDRKSVKNKIKETLGV